MILIIVAIFFVTRTLSSAPEAPAVPTPVAAASAAAPSGSGPATSSPDAASSVSKASSSPVADASTPSSAVSSAAPVPAGETSATEVEVVDAGTMSQESRRGLLLTLIQQGVFTGVQALDTPPKVGVTALFKGLSPNLQRQFIAVVYAYVNNGAAGVQTLQLIDAASGSQVGSYSASDGLTLG